MVYLYVLLWVRSPAGFWFMLTVLRVVFGSDIRPSEASKHLRCLLPRLLAYALTALAINPASDSLLERKKQGQLCRLILVPT